MSLQGKAVVLLTGKNTTVCQAVRNIWKPSPLWRKLRHTQDMGLCSLGDLPMANKVLATVVMMS